MIWRLYIACEGYHFSTRNTIVSVRQELFCCGLTTAGAEIGRPAYIVASQRRGAKGIVTFLGGILT